MGKSAMRLELDISHIREIRPGRKTVVSRQVLHINREELKQLLLQDSRIGAVDVELANPGEKCRVLRVADIVEPRAKTGDSGQDFPGALGRQATAGQGTTCVLRGAAVAVSEYIEPTAPAAPWKR